jgi:hypothetical protein
MLVAGPITNQILDLLRTGELFEAAKAIAGMSEESRDDFLLWTLKNVSMDAYYLLNSYIAEWKAPC